MSALAHASVAVAGRVAASDNLKRKRTLPVVFAFHQAHEHDRRIRHVAALGQLPRAAAARSRALMSAAASPLPPRASGVEPGGTTP